ncbi:Uncharacterised protein [uncultured archaeon]|nr:Uncharacterised protein [uncultured archaeon]
MVKFCTVMGDDVFIEAREAYEYQFGRWKRGSLKDLLEVSLKLFAEKYSPPHKKKRQKR